MRPRLLDLYCGAGGCSVGYARAGFDVTGVDNEAHRDYPFDFVLADAIDVLKGRSPINLADFDVIHASPPCQAYSITRHSHDRQHPDLLAPTRELLKEWGGIYVIENVPGAPMVGALTLCGSEFGLTAYDPNKGRTLMLKRHRLFESNVWLMGAGGCSCNGARQSGSIAGVYGGGSTDRNHPSGKGTAGHGGYTPSLTVAKALMGIDWMLRKDLTQAIPPAYTKFVGEQLIEARMTSWP